MAESAGKRDFWSLSPESLHQVTILMSDRGLPTDVRHINGYGSHTYSLINASAERFWVKFHFKPCRATGTGQTKRPSKSSAEHGSQLKRTCITRSRAAIIQSGGSASRSCRK